MQQQIGGAEAAHAMVAVADDQLSGPGPHLGRARRQLGQRHELAVRQLREVVLPGLAHVDEQRLLAGLEPAVQLVDGDLGSHGGN